MAVSRLLDSLHASIDADFRHFLDSTEKDRLHRLVAHAFGQGRCSFPTPTARESNALFARSRGLRAWGSNRRLGFLRQWGDGSSTLFALPILALGCAESRALGPRPKGKAVGFHVYAGHRNKHFPMLEGKAFRTGFAESIDSFCPPALFLSDPFSAMDRVAEVHGVRYLFDQLAQNRLQPFLPEFDDPQTALSFLLEPALPGVSSRVFSRMIADGVPLRDAVGNMAARFASRSVN